MKTETVVDAPAEKDKTVTPVPQEVVAPEKPKPAPAVDAKVEQLL